MLSPFRCRRDVLRNLFAPAFVAAILLTVCHASAAPVDEIGQTSNVQTSSGLSIAIEGTREHLAVGTGFAVTGTLTNNTKSSIYVNEGHLKLKVPAEIEGRRAERVSYWTAFLPAVGIERKGQTHETLELKPNQPTSVFWFVDPKEIWRAPAESAPFSIWTALATLYQQLSIELNYLFFVPGSYRLTVTADYWNNADLTGTFDVAVQNKAIDVAAPQSVILVGAAIGGLIAYMILPQARRRLSESTGWYRYPLAVWGAFGAMLLSAVITILLARISETQFLIRVTVSDFWGAIAIGFIGNYLGIEALNKIIKPPERDVASGVKPGRESEQEKRARQSRDHQLPQAIELGEGEKRTGQTGEQKR